MNAGKINATVIARRYSKRVSGPLALQTVCCIVTTRSCAKIDIFNGWVAQLVEQRTENPRVAGSIPAPARSLFSSQRGDRVHMGRAARGKKAREQRGSSGHQT